MSDSSRPHGLQHSRLLCPLPTPRACSHSCALSWWNHPIICCHPLLLPSVFPSIRVFSSESVFHIRWPEYWSFNLSISPSSEYSGLISFRMDWLDLLAVQETLSRVFYNTTAQKHKGNISEQWGKIDIQWIMLGLVGIHLGKNKVQTPNIVM